MDDFTQFQSISFGVDGMGQVQALTKALEAEAKAADDADVATRKVSKAKQQLARDAMEASRALQDFAQGGLGGVLNNLEGLGRLASKAMPGVTAFFGGPAGLAAAATVAGVAIWALQDPVKALVGWITSEGNGIPKATDAVGDLEEALAEVKGKLKEMKDGWDGSGRSVAEFNRLLGEQVGIEKKLAEARKERAAIDAQRAAENAPDRASGAAVGDAVKAAGGVDKVAADLAAAMPGATNAAQAQLDQLIRERDAAVAAGPSPFRKGEINASYRPQIAAAEEALAKARAEAQAGAQGVMGRALQGDQGAIGQMNRALPGRNFDLATTEALKVKKEAEAQIKDLLSGVVDWAKDAKKSIDKEAKADKALYAFDEQQRRRGDDRENRVLEGQREAAQAEAERTLRTLQREYDRDAFARGEESWDRMTHGGFGPGDRGAVEGAQAALSRDRRGVATPGEVDRALSEAQGALNMQMTDPSPDTRVISELSRVSAELVRVKQQLNNQARQAQQLRGQSWQGPATGNFAPEPFTW